MIGADVAAIVRVQEGPAPVSVGAGRAAAERYMRTRLHARQLDSSAWKAGLEVNWIRGLHVIGFFARGKLVGTDLSFGNIGQLGQLGKRTSVEASFALTLYRLSDPRCCPQGRTITMRFRWNGRRLVTTRPLVAAEGLQMPSRNIGCVFSRVPRYVRCDIRSGLKPAPPRPRGCDLDWAYGLEMTPLSRPKTFCAGDTALAQGPVLAYGAMLHIEGFTCLSRRAGLRCTNRGRHGFFLSRNRWRVF
jgi:hypothetical protein